MSQFFQLNTFLLVIPLILAFAYALFPVCFFIYDEVTHLYFLFMERMRKRSIKRDERKLEEFVARNIKLREMRITLKKEIACMAKSLKEDDEDE